MAGDRRRPGVQKTLDQIGRIGFNPPDKQLSFRLQEIEQLSAGSLDFKVTVDKKKKDQNRQNRK